MNSVESCIVPFVDIPASFAPFRDALLEDIKALIESGAFTNGSSVAEFEDAFGRWCGTATCVGTASGLDALRLSLLGLGIEPGDEVIVPASTFVATFEAVAQAGAVPVPVDISEIDYTMDPDAAEAAVTHRTRALLPVHLYGQMADLRRLRALAESCGLAVLEDACQAHGAERDGIRAGAGGDAAAFSFYPAKNLGAAGDAGGVTTNDVGLARTVKLLREHGQTAGYAHEVEGYTSRLDTIQALVLLHKLPYLDGWNDERRRIAAWYLERLAGVGDLLLPQVPAGSHPVWHLFVVRSAAHRKLEAFLRERGVATGRHYPSPPHLTPAYEALGLRPGFLPVAEALAREGISLPIFPGMNEEQLNAVVAGIKGFFRG